MGDCTDIAGPWATYMEATESNGGTRPPVVGTITSPSTPTATQQSSPTCVTSTNGVKGNHTGALAPDGDSVRLIAAPISTTTVNGSTHQSTNVQMSSIETSQSNQSGSPARPKADQVAVSVPLSSYHIPMNSYLPNGVVMQVPRPPKGFTMQQMQSYKMALAQTMEGHLPHVPYPGHLVPNDTHFYVQLGGTANLNIKLPQGRH